MVILTADGPLQNLLAGVKEPAEIRDNSGKILGHYTPLGVPQQAKSGEKASEPFDLDEAERILTAERDSGRPLQEFWQEIKGKKDAG